jgi:hypothetical protein
MIVAFALTPIFRTRGENFAEYLRREHIDDDESLWSRVGVALIATNRGREWIDAFREIAVLQLTRRLIHGGCKVASTYAGNDLVREREIKQMILETMVVDWDQVEEIYARLDPAIHAARNPIATGLRTRMESFARRQFAYCYLCGTDLEFDGDSYATMTLDHVWPQAFGGESVEDNLLPACRGCNERKSDIPSWTLYPIQALTAGFQPSSERVDKAPKELRFAVQSRAASRLAQSEGLSLRQAFVALGRTASPTHDGSMVTADVFSLQFTPA